MTPIPYRSVWSDRTHYLVQWVIRGATVFVVAPEGVQPEAGLIMPTRPEATAWLRENGFSPLTS